MCAGWGFRLLREEIVASRCRAAYRFYIRTLISCAASHARNVSPQSRSTDTSLIQRLPSSTKLLSSDISTHNPASPSCALLPIQKPSTENKKITNLHPYHHTTTKMSTLPAQPLSLPILLPAHPTNNHPPTHTIYILPHNPRTPTPSTPLTLFLANVPTATTPHHLHNLFTSHLGGARPSAIDLAASAPGKKRNDAAPRKRGKKRKRAAAADTDGDSGTALEMEMDLPPSRPDPLNPTGATATVTFVDAASLNLALKHARRAARSGKPIAWGSGVPAERQPLLGSARYRSRARMQFPRHEILQGKVDEFMTRYGALEAARERAAKAARNVPDEEGFVTVGKGGRNGAARREEVEAVAERRREREERGREAMGGFYRFQNREARKEREREVRERFEADRRRVEGMRGVIRPL